MRISVWMLGVMVGVGFMAGCGKDEPVSDLPAEVSPSQEVAQASPEAPAEQNFADPLTPPTKLQPLPVPQLIPPTTTLERLPQVDAGRSDPFASLSVTPRVTQRSAPEAAQPVPIPAAPTTVAVAPAPAVSFAPLPTLPQLQPAPGDLNRLPVPGSVAPALSPARAIEISGIVEVGGKTSIIIRDPQESSSRSVSVGDFLANGQVRVKRIEMGAEPVVILEENGTEVVRSIGSSGNLMMGAI